MNIRFFSFLLFALTLASCKNESSNDSNWREVLKQGNEKTNQIDKQLTVEEGDFLVSAPGFRFPDPRFNRAVILMSTQEDNYFGFKINVLPSSNLEDSQGLEEYKNIPVYWGGPVQEESLFVLHRVEEIAESSDTISDGLYLNGDAQILMDAFNDGKFTNDFKIMNGCFGWGKNQLMREIKGEGAWVVVKKGAADEVFAEDPDQVWERMVSVSKRQ